MSLRQRGDLVLLAHIGEQHRLRLGGYHAFLYRLHLRDKSEPSGKL
jgi:hypothetical protein